MRYAHAMATSVRPVGAQLREWRQRRRLSQLALACDVEMSTRHLSFVETGRSTPSRATILRLADRLAVPVRDRNVLLVAAGYAPVFPERALDDPALERPRQLIGVMLEAQKPYPAFALDRHWRVVASNAALPELYVGVAEPLLKPPLNGIRLTLHPDGMAPRIVNLGEWREHMLARLRHQIDLTADPVLIELLREILDYPAPAADHANGGDTPPDAIAVPFRVRTNAGVLSFLSTTTVFGTPVDVTLAEIALESFYPADAATVETVQRIERARGGRGQRRGSRG